MAVSEGSSTTAACTAATCEAAPTRGGTRAYEVVAREVGARAAVRVYSAVVVAALRMRRGP